MISLWGKMSATGRWLSNAKYNLNWYISHFMPDIEHSSFSQAFLAKQNGWSSLFKRAGWTCPNMLFKQNGKIIFSPLFYCHCVMNKFGWVFFNYSVTQKYSHLVSIKGIPDWGKWLRCLYPISFLFLETWKKKDIKHILNLAVQFSEVP